jgi:hypothetical protein
VPDPEQRHRRWPVLATAVLAAAVPLTGCSTLVPGRADSAGPTTVAPAPSRPGGRDGGSALSAGACQVSVGGRGNVRVSGGSSRVTTTNGASSLSCGGGPVLDIVEVADGALTLSGDGAAPVRIAAGGSAEVESYRVSVASVDGEAARFVLEPG